MNRIQYVKNRKNALRFIQNDKAGDIAAFLTSNDEVFLKEFENLGFIDIDTKTNTYYITKLGKEYIEEFYN